MGHRSGPKRSFTQNNKLSFLFFIIGLIKGDWTACSNLSFYLHCMALMANSWLMSTEFLNISDHQIVYLSPMFLKILYFYVGFILIQLFNTL